MQYAHAFHGASVDGNEIWVSGGLDATGQPSTLVEVGTWDGSQLSWSPRGNLPAPLVRHGMVVTNGSVYIMGGMMTSMMLLTEAVWSASSTGMLTPISWDQSDNHPLPTPGPIPFAEVEGSSLVAVGASVFVGPLLSSSGHVGQWNMRGDINGLLPGMDYYASGCVYHFGFGEPAFSFGWGNSYGPGLTPGAPTPFVADGASMLIVDANQLTIFGNTTIIYAHLPK
jgi:hypothetical protein